MVQQMEHDAINELRQGQRYLVSQYANEGSSIRLSHSGAEIPSTIFATYMV